MLVTQSIKKPDILDDLWACHCVSSGSILDEGAGFIRAIIIRIQLFNFGDSAYRRQEGRVPENSAGLHISPPPPPQ